ncbi:hypothetical protein AO284_29260 [Pseudomonas sp. NZIPFR-PS2]|nr:hypothetical protein AO284_29260 [Pseudomonas sp. NZIPFR-PS2]
MPITETRGVRNRNPGNIDYVAANQWQGQLKPDPAIEKRFARFDTPENGIRALGKLLLTYQRKHSVMAGFVKAIIHHENAGYAYPDAVLVEGVRRALA